ncbi:MAG: CBS domain-containing protein [Candidatus Omnitrophota bacterium]|nr:CBS domain-containing protein [Candidatus Omnitrophota bacterium]
MQVKNEMTTKIEVVRPETSVKEVSQKMRDLNIGVLPVCENNRLVGIVTDRDITVRLTAEGKDPSSTKVKEIMSSKVEWCFEDEEVGRVADKMENKKIRRLPVINHDKELVGMLSLGDIVLRGSRETACKILEKVSEPA